MPSKERRRSTTPSSPPRGDMLDGLTELPRPPQTQSTPTRATRGRSDHRRRGSVWRTPSCSEPKEPSPETRQRCNPRDPGTEHSAAPALQKNATPKCVTASPCCAPEAADPASPRPCPAAADCSAVGADPGRVTDEPRLVPSSPRPHPATTDGATTLRVTTSPARAPETPRSRPTASLRLGAV